MRARGFTLVEMLVALFVMAMLAMLSWRGIDGMVRAQQQTEGRADQVLALQTGLAQWTADLDAIIQLPQLSAIEWNGRVLRLTRRGTASATDGVRVVGWARREGQWRRWQSAPLTTRGEVETAWQQADTWATSPGEALLRQEVPVAPLEEWQIFYFRGDAWTNPQSSDATTGPLAAALAAARAAGARTTTVVPDGVRIVLQLPPGGALAGRITRDWVNPTVGGGKS
jgi:general secretion pathway protein J